MSLRGLLVLSAVLGLTVCGCPGDESAAPGGGASDLGGFGPPQTCSLDEECPGGACVGGLCSYPDSGRPPDLGSDDSRDAGGDLGVVADLGAPLDVGRDAQAPVDSGPAADQGAPDAGPECVFDTDCPMPFICSRAGTCIPECVEDRDCEAGWVCHQGGCRAPGGGCAAHGDCLPGEICHLGICKPEPQCILSDDCPAGQRCVDGECAPEAPDAGVDPVEPECEPAAGSYGEVCECASQCSSELCLDIGLVDRPARCTDRCDQRPCPGIDLCMTMADGTPVCVPNDAGLACRGGFECTFFCLTDPQQGSMCTIPCDGSDRCPQGWGCGPVGTDAGVQYVCLPAGTLCSAANQCAGQRCLPQQAGDPVGFCTHDCRNALDCPGAWSCCAVYDPALGDLARVCYNGPVCPLY